MSNLNLSSSMICCLISLISMIRTLIECSHTWIRLLIILLLRFKMKALWAISLWSKSRSSISSHWMFWLKLYSFFLTLMMFVRQCFLWINHGIRHIRCIWMLESTSFQMKRNILKSLMETSLIQSERND